MNTAEKKVHIQYFALLREERGLSSETVQTNAVSVGDLFSELAQRHHFSLPVRRLNVAVNENFANWEDELQDQDNIVFIPPVAGG